MPWGGGISEHAGDVAGRMAKAARLARLDVAKEAVKARFGYTLDGLSFEQVGWGGGMNSDVVDVGFATKRKEMSC